MITKLEIEITDPNKGSIISFKFEGSESLLPKAGEVLVEMMTISSEK